MHMREPQCCAGRPKPPHAQNAAAPESQPDGPSGGRSNDPVAFQFDLTGYQRPPVRGLAERWYPGARAISRGATTTRHAPAEESVRAIVIHATAGRSSAGAFSVIRAGRASFHWLVPHPSEPAHGQHVWATAPERRAAWHVANRCRHPQVLGNRSHLNHASLGIEIVNAQDGRDPFSQWQIAITAEIIRYAWAKYPKLETIVSHARLDPARRSDPGVNFPWDRLRALCLSGNGTG